MSFKLLAIRPLKGCSVRFLKNLEEDRIYKFYNDYSFFEDEDRKVTEIKCEDSVPENLYEKSGLDIQISALVGKNGSGKSSLLELLYASCYVIASKKGILPNIDSVNKEIEKIEIPQYSTEEGIRQLNYFERILDDSFGKNGITNIKINYTIKKRNYKENLKKY